MVDGVDALVPGLVEPVAAAIRVLGPRIPAPPAAELGRLSAPADSGMRGVDDRVREALSRIVAPSPAPAPAAATARVVPGQLRPSELRAQPFQVRGGAPDEPQVLAALRTLGPLSAERLLGALELTVPTLDVSAVPDVTPYAGTPPQGRYAMVTTSGDSTAVTAAGMLHRLFPDLVELLADLTRALAGQPAIAALLTVSADVTGEVAIAAAHGAAYVALGVATAAAVLYTAPVPKMVDPAAASIGIGVGIAVLMLRTAPTPAGYQDAVLERVRKEYLLPRRSGGSVPVAHHWFALVEGDLPAEVDFGANGLVTAVPGGAAIRTGRGTGQVHVRLTVLADEPSEVDGTGWDEIVDVSWQAAVGRASVVGPTAPGDRGLRRATAPWPGDYRLRVQARSRDDADDEESYDLVVWPAPVAPDITHKATDRLGHRLRGEPEPAPAEEPERAFRWLADSELSMAATVTVITGSTTADVVRAFGGDPDRPESLRELDEQALASMSPDQHVAVLADGAAVFVVEFNGWVGAGEQTLIRASVGGRAASMFWNVNALTQLSFAEDGRILAAFEPPSHDLDAEPVVAEALAGLDFDDPRHTDAKGLVAVARFTGHEFTAAHLARIISADVAFRVADS